VATIVPYDATRPTTLLRRFGYGRQKAEIDLEHMPPGEEVAVREAVVAPRVRSQGQGDRVSIQNATHRQNAVVEGRIRSVQVSPISGSPALRCELVDETGGVTLLFYGRRSIAGIEPGVQLRAEGRIGTYKGHLAIANPLYSLKPRGHSET
jgi:RecG-like helicase